jgi:hypothetical protein
MCPAAAVETGLHRVRWRDTHSPPRLLQVRPNSRLLAYSRLQNIAKISGTGGINAPQVPGSQNEKARQSTTRINGLQVDFA